MTEAYPLQWPAGKPRKQYPERSKFGERSIDAATTISAVGVHNSRRFLNGARRLHFFQR